MMSPTEFVDPEAPSPKGSFASPLEMDTAEGPEDADSSGAANRSSQHHEDDAYVKVPVEFQLHEVDMDDPKMDPLEWTVRRVVPIPKMYYWETMNFNMPWRIKLWHRAVGSMERAVHVAESAGEVIASVVGINSNSYDYVTSTMTEAEWEEARATNEERKKRRDEDEIMQGTEEDERELAQDTGSSRDVF